MSGWGYGTIIDPDLITPTEDIHLGGISVCEIPWKSRGMGRWLTLTIEITEKCVSKKGGATTWSISHPI